jgi:hypothetical protein
MDATADTALLRMRNDLENIIIRIERIVVPRRRTVRCSGKAAEKQKNISIRKNFPADGRRTPGIGLNVKRVK